ncbi:MAG: thiol-disulfide oxidoreductase DCC family protein [Verrucomicrobiales bacterium]
MSETVSLTKPQHILFFDGECVVCNRSVMFLKDHASANALFFAPLQGETFSELLKKEPQLEKLDSLILLESGTEKVFVHSEAALRALGFHPRWRWLSRLLRLIPRPIRDFGYRVFAKVRYKIFGQTKQGVCEIPPPQLRTQLLP